MKIFAKLAKELLLYVMVHCKVFSAGMAEGAEKNVAKGKTLVFSQKFVILTAGSGRQCPSINDLFIKRK